MKTQGHIQALSVKIAKNKKLYTIIELDNGQKIWCWDNNKLADFNMGDNVEIEAEEGQYPRLISIDRAPVQATLPQNPPSAPLAAGVSENAAGAKNALSGDSELRADIAAIKNYLAQFDKKYLELFQGVSERLAQEHATIQMTAGQVSKINKDLENLIKDLTASGQLAALQEED